MVFLRKIISHRPNNYKAKIGKLNTHPEIMRDGRGQSVGLQICLAPLSTMIFKV
ncbi:MAG: hypothetical protein ACHQUC_07540 [Chlamydiales bacterium]